MYLEQLIRVCLKINDSDTNVLCLDETEERGGGSKEAGQSEY